MKIFPPSHPQKSHLWNLKQFCSKVCWRVFCQLDTSRVMWKERISSETMSPPHWPGVKSVREFSDWWIMLEGLAHSRQCYPLGRWSWVLEESTLSKTWGASQKQHPGLCVSQLLPPGWTGTVRWNQLFLPHCFRVDYHSHRNQTRTEVGTRKCLLLW